MRYLLLALFLAGYLIVFSPFSDYMRNKPVVEKLGYVPQPAVLKAVSADQQSTLAAWLVMKVLFYFGSLVEAAQNEIILPPDYPAIQKNLTTAVELDPYNMDAYYFAQAILVWDAGRIDAVNGMLEHGMEYRTWDWSLPYFRGFNAAYFQKDYEQAARNYKKAADLSGFELFARLAGRYLYETSQTEQAISYLKVMEKNTRKESIRKSFRIRIEALQAVHEIETAVEKYRLYFQDIPGDIEQLIDVGFLKSIPNDPYGGQFYIDSSGMVRSTSKLSFSGHTPRED